MTTTRMVRKQMYISQDQEGRLKRRAMLEGRPEAEVVREYLEEGLARAESRQKTAEEAWANQLALMEERAKLQVPYRKRTWRREDAYEEREARLSRRHQHSDLRV